jgi:hypothetical protein
MSEHPYQDQKDRAFWSQSVSTNFNALDLIETDVQLLSRKDKVTSAGSCFASNLIPYIESAGLEYIRTERFPEVFARLGQNLGYANFSAMYGNVYTARQLRQLYERSLGIFRPVEDRWLGNDGIVDPFRPGLKFTAMDNSEFDLINKFHLDATRRAFESADVFVFTLGLTEGWVSKQDGSTYPACPGTIAGTFDSNKYEFKNFSVDEIVKDLSWFITKLTENNPKIRFILSVSPVPLVATATSDHVLSATIYSKSALRVAAHEIEKFFSNVTYFPAYEIITGPQAPQEFFESDRRNVSKAGVELVMQTLLNASGLNSAGSAKKRQFFKKNSKPMSLENLSEQISQAECDEVMLDSNLN